MRAGERTYHNLELLSKRESTQTGGGCRGYHRVLKVARTLADLDGSDAVKRIHLAEALSYRAIGEGLPLAA